MFDKQESRESEKVELNWESRTHAERRLWMHTADAKIGCKEFSKELLRRKKKSKMQQNSL